MSKDTIHWKGIVLNATAVSMCPSKAGRLKVAPSLGINAPITPRPSRHVNYGSTRGDLFCQKPFNHLILHPNVVIEIQGGRRSV